MERVHFIMVLLFFCIDSDLLHITEVGTLLVLHIFSASIIYPLPL